MEDEKSNADKKVKWGIMGTASIVRKKFAPALHRAGNARLKALASRSSSRAEKFVEEYIPSAGVDSESDESSIEIYASYEELLEDEEIDAVYISLPNHMHYTWSRRALKAGKHVLCEKPLVLSSGEGEELFRLAEKEGRFLMEGFMYRFRPLTERVIELARKELGKITQVRASFCYQSSRPAGDIRFQSETGGGALYDVGCYLVDFISNLFCQLPDAVFAHSLPADRGDVDGQGSALLIYENRGICPALSTTGTEPPAGSEGVTKTQVNLTYGLTLPGSKGLEIVGDRGRLLAPRFFHWQQSGSRHIELEKNEERMEITLPAADQFKNEIEYFSRMALSWPEGIKEAAITSQESLNNLAIIEAIRKSAEEGEVVRLEENAEREE